MTLRSDRGSKDAGLSLLEMLVVLAILAVITTAVAGRLTGPSARLVAEGVATDLVKQAGDARLEAMLSGTRMVFRPDLPEHARRIACSDAQNPEPITFFATGRAQGGPICVALSGETIRLEVDWLTAQAEARIL